MAGPATNQPPPLPAPAPIPSPLTLGAPVTRGLAAGERHAYLIELPAGRPCRFAVEQGGIDVVLEAAAPDGSRTAVDSPLDRQGTESLLVMPVAAGAFTVIVRAREPGAPPPGRYTLRADLLGSAGTAPPAAPEPRAKSAASAAGTATAPPTLPAIPATPAAPSTPAPPSTPTPAEIAAEEALTEAGALYLAGDAALRRHALPLYRRAAKLFHAAGMPRDEARAVYEAAVVARLVDEAHTALDLARQALELWRREPGTFAAAAENEIGLDRLLTGDQDAARAAFGRSHALARGNGDRYGEAVAQSNLCLMDLRRGALRQGVDCYGQAIPLLRQVGAEELLAAALTSAGRAYDVLGEPREARERYAQALESLRSTGNRAGEARTINNLGALETDAGDIEDALAHYGAALSILRAEGDRRWQARVLNNVGIIYQATGEARRALASFEEARALWQAVEDRGGEAAAVSNLGLVRGMLGEMEEALALHRRAVALQREAGDGRAEGIALIQLGRAELKLGRPADALATFEEAAGRLAPTGDLRNQDEALRGQGEAREALGDIPGALASLAAALDAARGAGHRTGEALTLAALARAERRAGAAGAARAHAAAALEVIESLRTRIGDPDLRASFSAALHDAYDLDIELLMEAHRAAPAAGFDREALAVAERARARTLLDVLDLLGNGGTGIHQGVDPALLARHQALTARLTTEADRAARGPRGTAAGGSADGPGAEQATLRELDLVEAEMRRQSPAYAEIIRPRPLDAAGMQALLDPGTLLLVYSLGRERGFLWLVGSSGVESFELPPRAAVEATARRLHELWSGEAAGGGTPAASAASTRAAAEMAAMLLGPVAGRLGQQRLVVVPDGALSYVPFAALPLPAAVPADGAGTAGDARPAGGTGIIRSARGTGTRSAAGSERTAAGQGPRALLDRHEVVILPSVSSLALERRLAAARPRPARWAAVLADPVFSAADPRLATTGAAAAGPAPSGGGTAAAAAAAGPTSSGGGTAGATTVTAADVAGAAALGFVRLPATRLEAEAIAALAPPGEVSVETGLAASREAVLGDRLMPYRIVHFATHGIVDTDHPALSGLALSTVGSDGRPREGFLNLRDVYNLRLDADLVVLSGCRTALGRELRGEGLIGLMRGFQYAGAARIVASLWQVDDRATALLMSRFYRVLWREGLPPAAALRRAQLALRAERPYRDPFFWAGFVLAGDWR